MLFSALAAARAAAAMVCESSAARSRRSTKVVMATPSTEKLCDMVGVSCWNCSLMRVLA